jgi:hypothetical protein
MFSVERKTEQMPFTYEPAPNEIVMSTVDTSVKVYSTDDLACARSLVTLATRFLDRASRRMTGENRCAAQVASLALVDVQRTIDGL